MNNKQRMNQLKNIILVLKENHKKEVANMNKINQLLAAKWASVNRIIAYRAEYEKMNANGMSMTVPALMKNMIGFMKKLDVAIVEENNAIAKIEYEKAQLASKVLEVDRKIKAMTSKFETLQLNERIKTENREAAIMDDMNAQSKSRESA